MKNVFRPAHKQRSTHCDAQSRECSHCREVPGDSHKPFPVCSGCIGNAFCSVECQRLAWKVDRPVCEHRRIAEEWNHVLDVINESILMNNLPSINHRRNLLDDFLEHHAWYLQRAICYSMRWLQIEETFDFSKSHMLIYLRYRPDCEDNPGVAFHIIDMVFRPFSQTITEYARAGPMLEAHRRHYQVKVAALKASDPDCIGALSIACMMEDQCVWMTYPYCLTPPEFLPFERDLQQRLGACWLEDLQRVVHMGLGYRKDAVGHLWRLGTLKKRKQEWCWQRLSKDGLVSFGYSRDHALGY